MASIIRDKRAKDFTEILISKIIVILLGILTGFLIPAALSTNDYGYYSLFGLYISYLGIFHLGFIDGLYLKYGNLDLDSLPVKQYRFFTRYLIAKQILFSLISIFVIYFFISTDDKTQLVLIFAAINMLAVNLQNFFKFTSQGVRNVRYTAVTSILQKIIMSIFALSTLFIHVNLMSCVLVLTFTNYTIFLIGVWKHKFLIFGESEKGTFFDIYNLGFPLLIANYVAIFIATSDKIFINTFYSEESKDTLAYYSFALSLLVIVNAVVDSIYQILYPNISRLSDDRKKDAYKILSISLALVTTFGLSGYFALDFLLPIILPKYIQSLDFLIIIFPLLIFSTDANVVKRSYIYADKKQKYSLIINIIVLSIGVILNLYIATSNMDVIFIVYSTLLCHALWSIILEVFFSRHGYFIYVQKYLHIIVSLVLYFAVNSLDIHSIIKFILFVFILTVYTVITQIKLIKSVICLVKR